MWEKAVSQKRPFWSKKVMGKDYFLCLIVASISMKQYYQQEERSYTNQFVGVKKKRSVVPSTPTYILCFYCIVFMFFNVQ